jgi:hypothetical protein
MFLDVQEFKKESAHQFFFFANPRPISLSTPNPVNHANPGILSEILLSRLVFSCHFVIKAS